jgi:hypothetical protein
MSEVAEHAEQTGSFESSVRNYVKRYNAIVERLEDIDAVPEDLFPRLDEDEADFGQLGAESKLLADYIDDVMEEPSEPSGNKGDKGKGDKGKPDLGILVALAPFLGTSELSKLVRQHFDKEAQAEEKKATQQEPDLNTIIGLAPHVDKATLGKMVRGALTNHPLTDPSQLVALAPHMDREEFGEILREQFPTWFGAQSAENEPPTPPAPPTPPSEPLGGWIQKI